jgi:hypothetical protein
MFTNFEVLEGLAHHLLRYQKYILKLPVPRKLKLEIIGMINRNLSVIKQKQKKVKIIVEEAQKEGIGGKE